MKPLFAAALLALTASASAAFTIDPFFPDVVFPETAPVSAPVDGQLLSTKNSAAK